MAAMLLKVCLLSVILTLVVMYLNFKQLLNCRKVSCEYSIEYLICALANFVIFIHICNNPFLIMISDFFSKITFFQYSSKKMHNKMVKIKHYCSTKATKDKIKTHFTSTFQENYGVKTSLDTT
jgi:hypothetical protein